MMHVPLVGCRIMHFGISWLQACGGQAFCSSEFISGSGYAAGWPVLRVSVRFPKFEGIF